MSCLLRRTVVLSALAVPCVVFADAGYPDHRIKLIVPFPAAGGTDTVARLLADKLSITTQWAFVIDNTPGAGGNVGMDVVAKSKADGYTLGLGQTSNLAINPALYSKMPYDAAKDVTAIALIAAQPMVLVVRSDGRFNTVQDLVRAAKAKPGSLTLASAGNGTVGHLTGELFAKRAGIRSIHVPHKGAAPAATDLLGGQVDYYFASPPTVVGFVKAGRLLALAVSSAKRLQVLPDTATIAEQGYPGFEANDWKVLVAPAGTPADVIDRLNAEAGKAMSRQETIAELLAEGSAPMSGSPQAAAEFVKREQERWGSVVRDSNVKVD
jgi:tripartite-type tricarboxylate transporter receptor subunit TctC